MEQWRSQVLLCRVNISGSSYYCSHDVNFSFYFQFKMWSTIDDRTICRFTSDAKDKPVSEYWVGGWKGR